MDPFNEHQKACYTQSDLICVDELMSQLYGQGGFWNYRGLPPCVVINWKLENGRKIQNVVDGTSRIMMQMKLCKTGGGGHCDRGTCWIDAWDSNTKRINIAMGFVRLMCLC